MHTPWRPTWHNWKKVMPGWGAWPHETTIRTNCRLLRHKASTKLKIISYCENLNNGVIMKHSMFKKEGFASVSLRKRRYMLGFLLGSSMLLGGSLLLVFVWQLRFIAGAILFSGIVICFFTSLWKQHVSWRKPAFMIFLLFCSSFFGIEYCIFHAMRRVPQTPADTMIVLGAKVNGIHPSVTLQDRLSAAQVYLAQHTDTKVVVSGGQGSGEDISEAAAMKNYLVAHGIEANRILLETASTTTKGNLLYSQQVLANTGTIPKQVIIVTSDYHMFRACTLAQCYFTGIQGLAGTSDLSIQVNYAIREYFAILKMIAHT